MDKVLLPRHHHTLELTESFFDSAEYFTDTALITRHGDSYLWITEVRTDRLECDACDGSSRVGKTCNEPEFIIHDRCAFVLYMDDLFDHPSHVGHRLKLLMTGAPDHTDPKCHLCGKNTKRLVYHCSTCKLNLDIDCMLPTLCAQAHIFMPWHPHPLLLLAFGGTIRCEVCNNHSHDSKDGYFCPLCRLAVHKECVSAFDSSLEITHPSHVRHPLKLLTDGAPSYTDLKCHLCGKDTEMLLYHCDICKFNLDFACGIRKPPPVTLSNMKVHEHTLTLMPKRISFVCDACGTTGDLAPYVCLLCDSMIVHQDCARLPRVIHVNHHDHRVSYKYPIGHGEWRCGVCWEEIDRSYGAYLCPTCPNYAIHPRCATREDVWDKMELDGVPEEVEDIEPFKINHDKSITHFGHEHNLSFNTNGIALEESILCGACFRPIESGAFYKCSRGDFFLHQTCANLPKKKRHFLSPTPLTLLPNECDAGQNCFACRQVSCKGFLYESYDLVCSSITVPFIHGSHPHPLFFRKNTFQDPRKCHSCGLDHHADDIGCIKCNFFLDFRCATLPLTVRLRRYDDHPLTLCYGEKASDKLFWCDICETTTNPETWFYTCTYCGVTLHVLCVLGDIRYANPGGKIKYTICQEDGEGSEDREIDIELLPNNGSSRPLCYKCHCRCPGRFILKVLDKVNVLLCSYYCFEMIQRRRQRHYLYGIRLLCPPWVIELNI